MVSYVSRLQIIEETEIHIFSYNYIGFVGETERKVQFIDFTKLSMFKFSSDYYIYEFINL